ncbi:ecdysteroid-regulated 16 kDa protein [Tribolium castaneum]|uniref:Protein NPC2 homolog-like Protein n=1 Tax=Tribolium castaneum TaxID=7070 RepID=D2A0E4_TRICA|nr:PREDICTED: ecdysteroid-regulated 16 kDa protein [Tribolium castaneum]EFA02897.1 Protein NPC2 homolog-like Protein [Tribolium castaneum]|eukprot:XP_975622.1 PREDICTED: ecdysteroid-regulated 16 kDa protein [Tribolium castaneum]
MLYKVAILLLFVACAYGYEDCGSKDGSVVSVTIANCDNDKKCVLKRNTNVSIEIAFTTNADSDTLTAVVHGVVLGVPLPFNLPNPDGCKDSGVSCPLRAGQSYTYKTSLPVLSSYPKVTVDVQWELKDKEGNDVVCILIPSQIK